MAFLVYMMVPVYLRLNILNHIAWAGVKKIVAVVQNIVATRMLLHKSVALWRQVAVEPIAATPSRQTAIGD